MEQKPYFKKKAQKVSKNYVYLNDNHCTRAGAKQYALGDSVIVINPTYMVDAVHHKPVHAKQFKSGNQYELLKIVEVNKPCFTCYDKYPESLGAHNNCTIENETGERFYCSRVNILKFA